MSSCRSASARWNTTPVTRMHSTATIRMTQKPVDARSTVAASIPCVTATAMLESTVKKQKKLTTRPSTVSNEPPSAWAERTSCSTKPRPTRVATAPKYHRAFCSVTNSSTLRRR